MQDWTRTDGGHSRSLGNWMALVDQIPAARANVPADIGVLLSQQGQHALWHLVGLCHHRSACLLQDLGA